MTGEADAPRTAVVIAAVWLHRQGGQVLGVRPHGSDVFFLPGGMPEPGESYAQAAAREVREETGMTVDAASLRASSSIAATVAPHASCPPAVSTARSR